MFFDHRSYWVSKDLDDRQAYQDAFDVDADRGLAAIADGASSSLFSARWAQLLTEAIVRNCIAAKADSGPWLDQIRESWREPIDEEQLAWHQKAKLKDGAHATLLWLNLQCDSQGREPTWRFAACAVGDCCLFVVRDNTVTQMFPLTNSDQFSARPQTVGSLNQVPGTSPKLWESVEGECRQGDLLVLTSDALASWSIRQLEEGREPDWESFWDISALDFEQRVRRLREENMIRYDDTTLLLLRMLEPSEPTSSTSMVDELKSGWRSVKDRLGGWGG